MKVTNVPPANAPLSFDSIVHINEKGGSFGGTEEYIALLTAALGASGVRSSLVCGTVTGAVPVGLDDVCVVPGLAEREVRSDTAHAVADAVAGVDADVIYVHNIFDPAIVPALGTLAGRGVLLWYVHDHYPTCLSELRWRRDLGSCPRRLGDGCLTAIGDGQCVMRHADHVPTGADLARRTALRRSMGAADGIIVVSEFMRSLLADAEPHDAADVQLFSRPVRDPGPLRNRRRLAATDPAVVTYAGRITPEKGLAIVIEALAATGSGAPVELRIAGVVEDHQYWAHCRQLLAAAQATNRGLTVSYVGHLDYGAMDEVFRQSDIVTVPSQWPEPLGAVALEAMAAGAAVIASLIGGLGDLVVHGRNGLHAVAGDVGSWTDALTTLLDRPDESRRLGEQGHRESTITDIAAHLLQLDTLVSSHRAERQHRLTRRWV